MNKIETVTIRIPTGPGETETRELPLDAVIALAEMHLAARAGPGGDLEAATAVVRKVRAARAVEHAT